MSLDECVFCSHINIRPNGKFMDYECTLYQNLLTHNTSYVSDDNAFEWAMIIHSHYSCKHVEFSGLGYSRFFRYIYIPLKQGRATQ
jgi:hypothetical protein